MSLLYLLSASTLVYLLVNAIARLKRTRQALEQIDYSPGERTVIGFSSALGQILPPIPYITLGHSHYWYSKYQIFERLGTDIYGTASIFPSASYFTIADPAAIKQVSYTRNNFVKNTVAYKVLEVFGSNLISVEGELWKRQRRIAAPAFSDKNNYLVWEVAKEFTEQMIRSWGSRQSMTVHDVSEDLALPLSICVIAKAGLGQDVLWGSDTVPKGHRLAFKDALTIVSSTMFLPLILPNWAWGLRQSWKDAKQAHTELRLYFHKMIRSRRDLKEQKIQDVINREHDLFNQLVFARDADDMLTEDELIGNVFIFLLAGHETTAHTFAIILGLLALYPDVQDKLSRQLQELQNKHGELTYTHFRQLTYAMAVVYETLRLFPMATIMPKKATSDTVITTGFPPNVRTVRVPASTVVHVCSTGLHYNPSYWQNPDEFDPERFMDPHWNRDAFVPFSFGPRACIGRRFAETALVAELTTLISKYKVSIDPSRFQFLDGETILERRSRLINPKVGITLTPAPCSLVFSPRD
ncbi:cytochrome P450 family protein [Rhizoctonia solani AG-3 Rhs1AP]|uniref:Cytochrome P450 family protein n=1 Tax=Rhizoctonia solani AG-3 Rhs1AP TaxID=1086054 RepID=A0A0A1ULT3_9AGAM|nr:cytochrome P450 family protein [Rhizoctonia solani AG-3 Rhs1AP]